MLFLGTETSQTRVHFLGKGKSPSTFITWRRFITISKVLWHSHAGKLHKYIQKAAVCLGFTGQEGGGTTFTVKLLFFTTNTSIYFLSFWWEDRQTEDSLKAPFQLSCISIHLYIKWTGLNRDFPWELLHQYQWTFWSICVARHTDKIIVTLNWCFSKAYRTSSPLGKEARGIFQISVAFIIHCWPPLYPWAKQHFKAYVKHSSLK